MGRQVFLAVTAVGAALALAGCGSTAPAPADPAGPQSAVPVAAPVDVELTDGRLGSATTVRVGARPRELTPGGRLDVRPDQDAERRDGVAAGAACGSATVAPAAASLPVVLETTLCLLNGERADRGLPPLAPNPKLATAATAYAQDLVDGSYFSHTGRDGSNVLVRIRRVGYLPPNADWRLGENLAWGTGALATPAAIMQAWMNSPGHRENILNADYREIGVGVVTGNPAKTDGAGATYATAFGVIENAATVVAAAPPSAKKARSSRPAKARKRGKRAARTARKAAATRHHGRGKGDRGARKHRGPKARISV